MMSKERKRQDRETQLRMNPVHTIPADVAGDDRFPFETGEEVRVTIDGEKKRAVVEKIELSHARQPNSLPWCYCRHPQFFCESAHIRKGRCPRNEDQSERETRFFERK